MDRSPSLSPILLAAACALAGAAHAGQKVPGRGSPAGDVPPSARRPLVDDATRRPIAGAEHAPRADAAIAPRAPAPTRTAAGLPYPLYDVDEHGAVWVRGRDYKASFDQGGATFVPFLGSDAPRNHPVGFDVRSVTSGGRRIAFDAAAPARRDGDVVAFARGAFVEEYAIEARRVEQRFVFETLPTRGEVVVTIDVTTDLAGRSAADGFRFGNDRGDVRYGRAVALDRRGRRTDVESRLQGGAIQLVVPAAFVTEAELPLVIDPYVSTITVDADADSDWQADVAYDATTNAFLVVYEEQFSATDHDVYGRKYVDQVPMGTATIDLTTDDWRNPKVSDNGLADHFLCVAQVGVAGSRIIRGRFVLAANLGLGSVLTISGSESGDKINPDVGGDPATVGPTYHCVVWQREDGTGDSDVHARLVGTGGGFAGGTIFLANVGTSDDEFPTVSKTNGKPPFSTQNWNIVWQHATTATDDDIVCARILWDGTITDGATFLGNTTDNERAPAASEPLDDTGNPRYWLAAYTIGNDLRLRVMNGTTPVGTTDILTGPLGSLGQPCVTTDGRKFPFAYTSSFGLFPNTDVDVAAGVLNYIAGEISFAESTVVASSSTEDETRPEIASSYTATVTNPWRNYVTYDANDGSDYDVRAVVYDTPANAGGYLYCDGTSTACPCANGNNGSLGLSGCANSVNQSGARLDVSGIWSATQDTAALYAQGMPGSATCLFFQGTGQILNGSPFGDGLRCASGSIVRLGTKTASAGTASYGYPADVTIHVKGFVPAAGGWRYYQCWYRNAAVFCSSSTFNLSSAAALLWSP